MTKIADLVKEKVRSHIYESVLFGITLTVFLISLLIFAQAKVDATSKNTIIIQKSKSSGVPNMVDIGGAVKNPGVYAIETGQRIFELVDKAGGLTNDADLVFFDKNINRAQKLNDQVKIYIPFKTADNLLQSVDLRTSSLISINSADILELESLPGVGTVTAKKILDNRPYGSLEDLLTKKILRSNVYEEIKTLITL